MAEKVGMTREIDTELGFIPWLEKITERNTLTLLCIKDKIDKIQESDYEILRALHGIWFNGEVPLYRTITIPDTRQNKQGTLFEADNTSENITNFDDARDKMLDGKDFVEPVKETKNKKKK
jgi:hypothetical protein